MKNELEEITMDSLRKLGSWDRYRCIKKRQEWLKKVRKDDKRQYNNLTTRINRYINPVRLKTFFKRYLGSCGDGYYLFIAYRVDDDGELVEKFWLG